MNRMIYCSKCTHIIFSWNGTRDERAPDGKHFMYYHQGCYAQLLKEREVLKESEVIPVSE